jgi:dTDP-4-amino-4,6-dideoxygalactose transaminase
MPLKTIPVANPGAQFQAHEQGIRAAIDAVLASGYYILGPQVKAFEAEFAAFCGAEFCVGVASGTDALVLALLATGIVPGDEVITVSHTAVATVAAIEEVGAVPVFADIDPVSRCLDPATLPALIGPRTKAIIPVHIFGQAADLPAIMKIAEAHGLVVVEDCAQAHGAEIAGRRVGTFGHAATFSFYPTKNLGAIGDGGAVVTNSAQIGARCRALREYGWQERYISSLRGINSRLDEIQAAILRVKLPHLASDNERRRQIAAAYRQALTGKELLLPAQLEGTLHAMHLFVVESDQREELAQHLAAQGIASARHYPMAVHQQPAYAGRIRGGDALPATERCYRRLLSLPMYPELTDADVGRVCAALESWNPSPGKAPL